MFSTGTVFHSLSFHCRSTLLWGDELINKAPNLYMFSPDELEESFLTIDIDDVLLKMTEPTMINNRGQYRFKVNVLDAIKVMCGKNLTFL